MMAPFLQLVFLAFCFAVVSGETGMQSEDVGLDSQSSLAAKLAAQGEVLEKLVSGYARLEELSKQQALRLGVLERDNARKDAMLKKQDQALKMQQEELRHVEDRVRNHDEELRQQGEKLRQQGEKMREQAKKLTKQDEELRQQGEKLRQQGDVMLEKQHELKQQRQEIMELRDDNRGRNEEPASKNQTVKGDKFQEPVKSGQPHQRSYQPALNKRSDDVGIGALEPVVSQLSQQVIQMSAKIQALEAKDQMMGTAYIRWGHASCPGSAELVYSGIVGGSRHDAAGGGSNYLCLHSHPILDTHPRPNIHGASEIFGSEYEICNEPECQTTPACAVCRISRSATVMIPGTNTCSGGWTQEYSGYIMTNLQVYSGSSDFICVDSSHEYIHVSQKDDNQNLLFYVMFKCGALPCPPYVDGRMATCVVCSR